MKFTAAILAFALTAVLATPVKEERELEKRGAVLTAQFATESEVSYLLSFIGRS
jgi:hypothetical protein